MKNLLVEIRNLYDDSSITAGKVFYRLSILAFLFLSHFIIWLLGFGSGHLIYGAFAKHLGYLAEDYSNLESEGAFFLMFAAAASLFLIHVLLYALIWLILKIKPHFDMLVSVSFVTFLLRDNLLDANDGSFILSDLSFTIAWHYAYAAILLAIFCAAIILSRRLPVKKFPLRILAAAAASLPLGALICGWIWQTFLVDVIRRS